MDTPAHVVGRTGVLLRALASHEPDGAGTSDLARAVGLPRPTVHRLLASLLAEGFADRDEATGRWLLGPELHLLGAAAGRRYDVTSVALPHVRRLATATGESAFLSVRRGEETVCLIREDGSFPLRSHVLHEGIRFPLGVVSAGLAVLAFLPSTQIDDYLRRVDLTPGFGPSHAPPALRDRLEQTRRNGWSLNPGLIVEGSWGMAAAVFDADDSPRWALSLTGVERRFTSDRRAQLGRLLLDEAHELGRRLRSRGDRLV